MLRSLSKLVTYQCRQPRLRTRIVVACRHVSGISLPASTAPLDDHLAIKLRDYQEECIQSVLQSLKAGHKRLGISLATGSGKTVIFTHLIDRIRPQINDATQTLIIVHRRELVEQAARHCANVYHTKSIEIEMGGMHASGAADITVASIWSLVSQDRMTKFDPLRFKLVLIDEAHHAVAASYLTVLKHFHLLKEDVKEDSPALVGVSATMSRFDGLRLMEAMDYIVYHKDYVDMIREKWLSNVVFTTVQSKADLSRVKVGVNGDFQVAQLSRAVNTPETNRIAVQAWQERASGRASTLVFCTDVAHVTDLTAAFRECGIDARFITGDTHKQTRSERLDGFKSRQFPVLLNCGVFTEGTDIPNIDCVLLARPTKSRNLLVQMIGRGMRLHPGKENCHVIDMVASLKTGIVTIPTLFGLNPDALVKEETVEGMEEKKNQKEAGEQQESQASKLRPTESADRKQILQFTDYDSVYDLIEDTSGERHIRGMSPYAWVMVDPQRYILTGEDGSYLSLTGPAEDDVYTVTCVKKMSAMEKVTSKSSSPFCRARQIASALGLSDTVHGADTFASNTFVSAFIRTGAAWRNGAPTESQLTFLNSLRPQKDQLTDKDVTKGKAMDMITKLKFGAKGRFKDIQAGKRREGRVEEQVRRFKERNHSRVRVGPIAQ